MKLFFLKNKFWWKFCWKKITFGSFYAKKRHLMQLCVFSKTNNCLTNWKKTVFLSRLLRRIRFWNMFLTKSQIRIKIFKISQFLVNFTKLVIFCIGNFTECEILKHIFYHTSALNGNFDNATQFHMKLVSKYQAFLDSLLSKNLFFCQFTPLKCQSWRFPTFLESLFLRALFRKKTCFESKFSRKIRLWTNFFYNASDIWRKRILRVKVWIEYPHSVKTWIKSFTTHQISKWNCFFKKTNFDESFAERKSLLDRFTPKTPSYATLRFLKNQQLLKKLKKKQFS